MSSDGEGHIIINCQECGKTLITIDIGNITFHGGISVRCVTCEAYARRPFRGGMAQ